MKNMKKQLFTAVAMLLVATVALGTATFAWFVNNATVEVAKMDFTATTSKSLEIGVRSALTEEAAAFDATKFKGILATADIAAANANYIAAALNPASGKPGGDNWKTAASFFKDKTWGQKDGTRYAIGFEPATLAAVSPDLTAVPLIFRASEKMNVYLKDPTAIFVNPISSADWASATDEEKALIQTLTGAAATETSYGTTKTALDEQLELIKQAARIAFVSGDKAVILAPAGTGAVTGARSTALRLADGTATAPDTEIPDGQIIKALKTTTDFVAHDGTEAGGAVDPTTIVPGGTADPAAGGYLTGATTANALFTLEANTPKEMTAYIWLEGCDKDCVSAIASHNFGVKLDFVGGNWE